ncbi:hypothetical protein AN958_11753, partial [Leucoagaricus sp. SymC.cos]
QITHYANIDLDTQGHKEQLKAVVTTLDSADIFLGHDWLVHHNPEIDWKEGIIKFTRCPPSCDIPHRNLCVEPHLRRLQEQDEEEEEKQLDPTTIADLPPYMQKYTDLFNKNNFDRLPDCMQWDHEIKLMDDALPELRAKIYPMTIKEEEELNTFINKNLKSGRIRVSKSQYATPCFFIPKKDGSK